jgi:hypothetical protein
MSGKKTPVRDKSHGHEHGPDCGHKAIEYKGRVNYVHNKHLSHKLGDQWRKAVIEKSVEHPDGCTAEFNEKGCWAHDNGETCGPGCGHEPVTHEDHTDYLVPDGNGGYELHCPHDGHCDHHGHVKKHTPPSRDP